MKVRPSERGAALLAVLLLVAVMGALTAAALEKLRLSTALAINTAALDQARAFAVGIESLMALTADDLLALDSQRTTNAGGWNGGTRRIPLPDDLGLAEATVRDGGNCFNVNSVAEGVPPNPLVPRASGIAQFASLMRLLGVPQGQADRIAASAGDWVDGDDIPSVGGGEDAVYAGAAQPYRAGNTLFADVTELRAVQGMTPEIYAQVRPWICALPSTDLSPININTLSAEQAPLLAMLAPDQIPLETARAAIAARPVAGWDNLYDFYRLGPMQSVLLPLDVQLQPQLRTRWFSVDIRIALQGAELRESALIDARIRPARVIARRWGSED